LLSISNLLPHDSYVGMDLEDAEGYALAKFVYILTDWDSLHLRVLLQPRFECFYEIEILYEVMLIVHLL